MVWQNIDPVNFIWDFRDRIYHVDCKDTKVRTPRWPARCSRVAPALGRPPPGMGLRLDRAR